MNNIEYMKELSERLKAYYNVSFDISLKDRKFEMFAKFNNRTSRYVLMKKSEIYAFENNEFIFYKNVEKLSKEDLFEIKDFVQKNIEHIVKVNDEHMSSTITFIFCGNIILDKETIKAIQGFRYYKSFLWGIKGWVNVKFIFVNPETWDIYTNKYGEGDRKKFLFCI
ncbi:hypothetical protein [Haloimpatiens lingqiaonensis]|uniref:hypothetical protein n=1 Tax=Haloimpatiens lingqiaonensis TaxID=1380675 RepID=UPI0010FDFB6B|nr:hypothetical protein [Haloimpatiens lingqiaonensis]